MDQKKIAPIITQDVELDKLLLLLLNTAQFEVIKNFWKKK